MKEYRFYWLWSILFSLLMMAGLATAQESQQIDKRIWSMSYWLKLADQGLITFTPADKTSLQTPPQIPDSKIHAKSVLTDDSPDVRVTPLTNVTQSEVSVFINPNDDTKLLNSNNSSDLPVSTIFGASYFHSEDGGLTWAGSEQGAGGQNRGDPATGIDLNGRYYIGYIASNDGQGCSYSTDEGQSWTAVQVANPSGDLLDKNHLWVDHNPSSPYANNVYSAWTDFASANTDVMLARSTDGGLTWSAPVNVSQGLALDFNQGVNIQTGPNGEVYCAWVIYDSFPSDDKAIGFAKSLDGGVTWSTPIRAIDNIRGLRSTGLGGGKSMRVSSFPSMTVNQNDGTVYIVWPNIGVPGVNSGDPDIYMIKSSDGGSTWNTPSRINTDPIGNGKDQWYPWIACDPSTGFLVCIFYDSRNFPGNDQAETFVAASTDNGNSWEDFKVSDVSWTGDGFSGFASGYAGDYIGIDILNGKVYPMWADVRGGQLMTWVSPFLLADPTDPNPPSGFEAYSDYTTPTSMALTWTDPTSLANGDTLLPSDFRINILRDDVAIDSVSGGTEQYTDMGLMDGVQYTYTLFTKVLANDSTSLGVNATWTAGGAKKPENPTNFFITQPDSVTLMMHWTNPSDNVDGTPMDDFDGINLYEDGSFVMAYSRSSADTGKADSASYSPPAGTHQYYATAFDNESPSNESSPSNAAYSPIAIPFFDDFPVVGPPNPGYWLNNLCEVTTEGDMPPSPPNVLNLDGDPSGGGDVALLPVDMSGLGSSGIILAYWWQPQGLGDTPEAGDDLYVDFLNDQGTWVEVRHYVGTPNQPFQQEVIAIAAENPGSGATFFHPAFQFRFRNSATAGAFDDWNIDNVFLGLPTANPQMLVSPLTITDTLLIGASSIHSIGVTNQNQLPSTLNYVVTENPPSNWLTVAPTSGSVPSSQTEQLSVTLDASAVTTSGVYVADVVIAGDDSTNLEDTVRVTLVANDPPAIRVEPDSIALQLAPGQKDSTTFTVYNDGLGPLQILSIEDEEVNASASFKPAYVQEQRPTVYYEKGKEPPSNGGIMPDGEGGPDPFGYKWIDSDEPDGPAYVFTDISTSGTPITFLPTGTFDALDEGMATVNLPFDVKLYGNSYNQVQVNTNGACTFDMSFFDNMFTNVGIPSTDPPQLLVAPFWDDLDGRSGGSAYYEQVGNQFIVQWHNWGHYPSGTQNMIFQVVFFQNSSTIWFVYENIDDQASSTFGIENMDGTIGLEIAFDQTYAHNQLLTKISKGAEWLSENPSAGTVAPGDSLDITLTADATLLSTGIYGGRVLIDSNDPLNATVIAPVVKLQVGQGTPAISVSTTSIAFDTVGVGLDSTTSFMVQNVGGDTLEVFDMLITQGAFSVDTSAFTLLPSATQEVQVTFTPPSMGQFNGFIRCVSNDPVNDTISIAVSGYGEPPVGIDDLLGLPTTYDISSNYPNPFNPTTTIKYQLPQTSDVGLVIFNILGQKVRTLVNGRVEAGYHTAVWDGRNESGARAASGIYIYRFQADNFLKIQKMILMK